MSVLDRLSSGESKRVTIRLESEIHDFYRREAQKNGVSLSEYLRKLLTEGFISESIDARIFELEESMKGQMAAFEDRIKKLTEKGLMSDRLLLSFAVLETLAIEGHMTLHGANSQQKFQQAKEKAVRLIPEFKAKN